MICLLSFGLVFSCELEVTQTIKEQDILSAFWVKFVSRKFFPEQARETSVIVWSSISIKDYCQSKEGNRTFRKGGVAKEDWHRWGLWSPWRSWNRRAVEMAMTCRKGSRDFCPTEVQYKAQKALKIRVLVLGCPLLRLNLPAGYLATLKEPCALLSLACPVKMSPTEAAAHISYPVE